MKPRGRAISDAAPEIHPSNSSVVWLVESTNRGSNNGFVWGVASPGSHVVAEPKAKLLLACGCLERVNC